MFSFMRLSFFVAKWSKHTAAKKKVAKWPTGKKIKNAKTVQKKKIRKIEYLECYICKKRLQSNRIHNLKRHLNLHSPTLSRCKCIECGRSYSSHGNFVKHLPRWHPDRDPKDVKYEPTNEGVLVRPFYAYQ